MDYSLTEHNILKQTGKQTDTKVKSFYKLSIACKCKIFMFILYYANKLHEIVIYLNESLSFYLHDISLKTHSF